MDSFRASECYRPDNDFSMADVKRVVAESIKESRAMSDRDQISMAALTGLLARYETKYEIAELTHMAYEIADAMIEARK